MSEVGPFEQLEDSVEFGITVDVKKVLGNLAATILFVGEVVEIDIVVPVALGVTAIEAGLVIADNPPTEVVVSVAKGEFGEAARLSVDYIHERGEEIIRNGIFTRPIFEQFQTINNAVVGVGALVKRTLSSTA